MAVIPFDSRRRCADRQRVEHGSEEASGDDPVDGTGDRTAELSSADTPSAEALNTPRGFPFTDPRTPEQRVLGEAVKRIEQLERSLIAALKENAANWNRAERAERRLKDLEKVGPTSSGASEFGQRGPDR